MRSIRDSQDANLSSEQQELLIEIAAEIQKLLNHVSENYPTKTAHEKIVIAAKVVSKIEKNPTLRQKIISALRAGDISAIETMLAHPASAITLAALKSWEFEDEKEVKK